MHSTIGFFPPDDICEHESDDTSNLDPYVDAWEHAIAWEYHPGFSDSVDKAISLAPTLNFPAVPREQCLKMDEQAIHVPMPMLRAETSVGDPHWGYYSPSPTGIASIYTGGSASTIPYDQEFAVSYPGNIVCRLLP